MGLRELSDDQVVAAMAETEQEIFAEGTGGPMPDEVEDNEDIVEDLSRVEDWAGRPVSDHRLAGEATGDVPVGMSMGELDGEDAEAIAARAYEQGPAGSVPASRPASASRSAPTCGQIRKAGRRTSSIKLAVLVFRPHARRQANRTSSSTRKATSVGS